MFDLQLDNIIIKDLGNALTYNNILYITNIEEKYNSEPLSTILKTNITFINKSNIYKQLFNNDVSAINFNVGKNINSILSIEKPKIIVTTISSMLKLYNSNLDPNKIDYVIINLNTEGNLFTALKFLRSYFKFYKKKINYKIVTKISKVINNSNVVLIADTKNKILFWTEVGISSTYLDNIDILSNPVVEQDVASSYCNIL